MYRYLHIDDKLIILIGCYKKQFIFKSHSPFESIYQGTFFSFPWIKGKTVSWFLVSVIRSPVPCHNANFKLFVTLKLLSHLEGERNKVLLLFFLNIPTFLFYLVYVKYEFSIDKASKGQLKNKHKDKSSYCTFSVWKRAYCFQSLANVLKWFISWKLFFPLLLVFYFI